MKHNQQLDRRTICLWGCVAVALLLSIFSLQVLALWLPGGVARHFASNASVWPIFQLAAVIAISLLGIMIWCLGKRILGIIFVAVGFVCLVPTLQMIHGLHRLAAEYDVKAPLGRAFHLLRTSSPADGDIKYGRGGQTDLYLSHYASKKRGAPAVLYVHGGGWTGGSRTEDSGFFRWFNARGYDVFSIDYRFARADYATWQDAPRDVVCALSWLNDNAADYGVDASRTVIVGDSAGGQLAMRAAYGLKNGSTTSSCGGVPVVPYKVVGIVPSIDLRDRYETPGIWPGAPENVVQYLGGTPETVPDRYTDATIMTHVRPGLQPTLIINGDLDVVVSPGSGTRLADALRREEVEVEQYTLPYTAHAFWINPGGYQNQTARILIAKFLED